eukprot:2610056-Rhodomonas_salina.1
MERPRLGKTIKKAFPSWPGGMNTVPEYPGIGIRVPEYPGSSATGYPGTLYRGICSPQNRLRLVRQRQRCGQKTKQTEHCHARCGSMAVAATVPG